MPAVVQFCPSIIPLKDRVAGAKVVDRDAFCAYVKDNISNLLKAGESDSPDEGDPVWALENGEVTVPLPAEIFHLCSGGIGPKSFELKDYTPHYRYGAATMLLRRKFALPVVSGTITLLEPDAYYTRCDQHDIVPVALDPKTTLVAWSVQLYTAAENGRHYSPPQMFMSRLALAMQQDGTNIPRFLQLATQAFELHEFWRHFAEVGDEMSDE